MEKTFRLFRLYDEQHIICGAPVRYKNAYYEALLFLTEKAYKVSVISGYESFFTAYKDLWSITECGNMRMKNTFAHLNKVDKKRHSGFFGFMKKPIYSRKYIYLLIIEAAYILSLANKFNFTELISEVEHFCKVPENIKNWLQEYFSLLFVKDIQTHSLIDYVQNSNIKYMTDTVKHITEHLLEIKAYETLPVFNISVIATMSAGKSTFVNALLGNEIFPEANEACTTKITSIYDNDFYHRIVGVGLHNGEIKEVSNNLRNEDLIKWNTNKTFDRIILEGDLDNITNTEKIVAVHDTPGTNFSGDEMHKYITMDFLKEINLDLMLCVLNAESLATTDEAAVLEQVKQIIKTHEKMQLIFIVNKIDMFDTEKESLRNSMQVIQAHLSKHGFDEAIIIPTSAKAARLLKMALCRKHDRFTEDEMDTFRKMFRKFSKGVIAEPIGIAINDEVFKTYSPDEKIEVDDTEYNVCDIEKALYNTGFCAIEKFIENQILMVNGGEK